MARYYDANGNEVRRSWGLFKVLMGLCVMAFMAIFTLQAWPKIQPYIVGLHLPATQAPIIIVATPRTEARPTPYTPYTPSKPNTTLDTPANMATAEAASLAAYATAVARANAAQPPAAPIPNVDNTGDSAPLIHVEKPAEERQPAGDNVSVAEPTPQANDQIGSKPTGPINIQETHQCLHGQVWTDSGCHRPTPVK
jgi:hypothetical protein